MRITKTYTFSASHWLDGLPDGHKCGRLHGHNYRVTAVLEGPADAVGMVVDYGEIDATFGKWVRDQFDHRHLGPGALYTLANLDEYVHGGDPVPFAAPVMDEQPTAENLAALCLTVLRAQFGSLAQQVIVEEGDRTSASVSTG